MKKTLLTIMAICAFGTVYAQTPVNEENTPSKQVLTNSFGSNWFITANGGAQILFSDYDKKGDFGHRIAPTVDLGVGKWFTPGLGLRFSVNWMQAKGYSNIPTVYTDGKDGDYYKDKWNLLNFRGDVLFNLTNMICAYKEDRLYHAIPFLGFGLLHSLDGNHQNDFAATIGFLNTFRISNAWDVNLEAKASIVKDEFDLLRGGKKFDALASLSVGFTYKFAPRGFKKPVKAAPVKQLITAAELDDIRTKLAVMGAENEELKNQLANNTPKVIEKEVVKEGKSTIAPRAVFFTLGSSAVSPQELVNLGFQADQMKAHPGLKYIVTGYADAATGTAEVNKKISLKRAQAVIDALVKTYGIDRSCMRAEAFGGAEKFDKDYLNRTVIIEAE